MKILLINPLDYRYGTTYRTRMFFRELQNLGHTVYYVESNYKTKEKNVLSIRQGDNLSGYFYGNLKRFYISFIHKYDILFFENFTPLTLTALIAAKLRNKYIIVDWDAFEFMFQKNAFRKLLTYLIEFICPYFVHQIISPSSYLIKRIKRRGIRNISKVPQLIDTDLFNPDRFNKHSVKKKLGWENKIVIGYLCAFNPGGIRDLEIILQALKIVIKQNKNIQIILIGEGRLKYKVLELLKQYRIDNYCILGIQSQDEVVKYLSVTDICLVYLKEDLGSLMRTSIKLPIYLAMNKIVVGHVVGESRDSFRNYIVPAGPGIHSFAHAVKEIMGKGDFDTNTRTFVLENYDIKLLDKYLREVIRKTMN